LLGHAKLVIAVRKGEGKLGSGPSGEESDGLGRKEVGHGQKQAYGPKQRKEKGFYSSLFLIFPKQVQNEISTQFEIRLHTKQFKRT